jgi:sugar fermentation stimulation protein A
MEFYHGRPYVRFPDPLEAAIFRTRLNRFSALVELDETSTVAHLPNSGRLGELLTPGARAWLVPKPVAHRRTAWDLLLVEYLGRLVSVDARLPNNLVAAALAARALPQLAHLPNCRAEVSAGASRLDFLLWNGEERCFVEVKSVTLVVNRRAIFPDAPTLRGARHLRELAQLVGEGHQAAVLFIVQRDDAQEFAPHDAADPVFAEALRAAARSGVDVRAYRCGITLEGMALGDEIPVVLNRR